MQARHHMPLKSTSIEPTGGQTSAADATAGPTGATPKQYKLAAAGVYICLIKN